MHWLALEGVRRQRKEMRLLDFRYHFLYLLVSGICNEQYHIKHSHGYH